jgi:hypothetical protein
LSRTIHAGPLFAALLLAPIAGEAEERVPVTAEAIAAFVQVAPVAGLAPTRRTELRMEQDGRSLFIHVRAYDPEPAAIVAQQRRRDAFGILAEDCIQLVFDPEGDGRNGFLFAVNAQGTQYDALIFDGGQIRYDWDAIWRSEARREADGWSADIVIPLSIFGHKGASTRVWRFNAERWMPRGSERVRLAGIQADKEVYSLGDASSIPAIRAQRHGLGLRLKPSLRLTAESSAAAGTGESRQRLEPALELFHQSDNGLRTTLALNIDFGEAEADERTDNMTRFELFLPEKREFFLQDAGYFSFGGLVEDAVAPYYSRRIGVDSGGRAHGLDAGLKFSGSVEGFEFGAFGARVAGGPTEPGEPDQRAADVAVVRVAQPLASHSRIGAIATQGNPAGTSGSSLWGVDYQYRETDWLGDKTLEGYAWLQQSHNDGPGTGRAVGGSVSYPNIGPTGEASVQRIDASFNPALGYLAEAGVTRGEGSFGWWFRTDAGEDIIPAVDWSARRTLDGSERSSLWNPEIALTNAAGDTAMVEAYVEEDRLARGYTPLPGLWLEPGNYRWNHWYGLLETSSSRPVSGWVDVREGGYYDGHRSSQGMGLRWKPSAQWGWRTELTRSAIDLSSGSFTVRTATLELDYTPSTRLLQSVLLQWDNVSEAMGVSARVRWLLAPGSELIFALDRIGYTGEQRDLEPQQAQATIKWVWNLEH